VRWRVQTIARTIAWISWLTARLRILSQPSQSDWKSTF
jgi:hypothetical protein